MVYDQAATARPPSGVLSSIHNGPDLLDPTGDWPVSLAESYSERYHHLLSPSTPWEDWFECLGHQGTYEWELGSDLLSRIVGHLSLHTWFPLPQILMVATSHNELYNGAQQLGFSTILRDYVSEPSLRRHLCFTQQDEILEAEKAARSQSTPAQAAKDPMGSGTEAPGAGAGSGAEFRADAGSDNNY
ncbi:hypothetical protein F4820DRAFT_442398 [Hypoxylon rubiginosum]|uniref:Uncharacterized protein n=1 Tax=Hypoxylon rubiginosum TaxID=110542 RepID=A0ACB9ZGV0_9PEZI|nr:hypothetical protein F4820DRAFT_442398 [Hypoxylon rubiginosum]